MVATELTRHHTLKQDLVRAVLVWSGYFFAILAIAFFATINNLVDLIVSDIAADRMRYQVAEFSKHLSENHRDTIFEEAAALAQSETIGGILLADNSDRITIAAIEPNGEPGLSIKPGMKRDEVLRHIDRYTHLHLFTEPIPDQRMTMILIMDDRPIYESIYAATAGTTVLLLLLVAISIIALHRSLRNHLITPIDNVLSLMDEHTPSDEKANLFEHLPDEVAELAHSYEQLISERQFIESELRQAQKLESLGTLVGGIAHNFNNTLAGMTGNLYIARQLSEGNAELQSKLDRIEQMAFHTASIIKKLLAFAQQNTASLKPVDLAELIRNTTDLYKLTAPKGTRIEYEITESRLAVKADTTQLQQVLLNLMINAFDATEQAKHPCVTVRLQQLDADQNFLATHRKLNGKTFAHLSIRDNGCGIPPDSIEHIFEPFFTTKEVGKGTGLGLSMVYGTISEHGGAIDVRSDEHGTCIDIYLPALLDTEMAEIEALKDIDPIDGNGETILLIDDDDMVTETTKAILENLNYKVLTANSGVQGVESYKAYAEEISLVLLDIVMPVLSGPDTAKAIRSVNSDARILFITGYDQNQSRLEELEVFGPVLAKPYTTYLLSQAVRSVIDRH